MDKIPFDTRPNPSAMEESVLNENAQKKKIAKSVMNNAGIFIGAFIVFAVIIFMTTDVKVASIADITSLGLEFFLILFCTYYMYISCANVGAKAGLKSQAYSAAMERYDTLKRKLVETGYQSYLYTFCQSYIDKELRNTKTAVLITSGYTYEQYVEQWSHKDKATVEGDKTITEAQKKAIIKANAIRPIKLTPDMIMRRGRGQHDRNPLSFPPELKKYINFGSKLLSGSLITMIVALIVLDMKMDTTWVVFATIMLKLLNVVINGFSGYRYGYENIVVDTVNYIEDQADLLEQAITFAEGQHNGTENQAECT